MPRNREEADLFFCSVTSLQKCETRTKLSRLSTPANGHRNTQFDPVMSYTWGTVYLIHRVNTHPNLGSAARFYRCGDLSRARLLDGAEAYNGGGDPDYRQKVSDALDMIGCLS